MLEFMKKHIANIITASRILLSVVLLFLPVLGVGFYIAYLLCGITDMIDGTVARKTGAVSEFGARLDSIADIAFLGASLIKCLPVIVIPLWMWIWVGIIALIRIGGVLSGFVRTRKLVFLHTFLNKATGLMLFLLPLTLSFLDIKYSGIPVCIVATAAAIQECFHIGTKETKLWQDRDWRLT